MMDLSVHSQYTCPVGWDHAPVSHTSISPGGPRVPIQRVPGGKDLTSGECSLGQTITI